MPRMTGFSNTPDRIALASVQVPAALLLGLPLLGLLLALTDGGPPDVPAAVAMLPLGPRPSLLLARSVAFSAAVAGFASLTGFLIARGVLGTRRGVAILSLALPPLLVVPISIHGLNWATSILQLNDALMRHHLPVQINGWTAAWFAEVLAFLPLAIGIAWTSLALLDRRLLESAMIFRSPRAVAWRIAFPMAGTLLASGMGLIFLLSVSDYTVPSLFAVQVYALEIFCAYSASSQPAGAVLTAMPLMLLISLAMVMMLRTACRTRPLLHATPTGPWPCRAAPWHAAGAVALLLLLLALPMAFLTYGAGSWPRFAHAVTSARDEILVSLRVAVCTAVMATLLGAGVAHGMMRGRALVLWWAAACLWFAMPAPLVGIGILQIASRAGAWTEPWLPVWACLARFLPVAAFICYAVFQRMDPGLLETARIYQRNRLHGMLRITLPLAWRGLFMAATTCFALSLGELGASLLVAPPGQSTLVIRLYNLLHYGASQEVAALGLALSLPALGAGFLLIGILRRRPPRT